MSCILIYYENGAKMTRPIYSRQEYMALRDSDKQKEIVSKIKNSLTPQTPGILHVCKSPQGEGEQDRAVKEVVNALKRKLVQFNYSCIPGEDGKLKGCKVASTTVGMDIDFDKSDPDYAQKMEGVPALVLSKQSDLGLLMLERSASKGYHLVFKRRECLTQEENLQ